MNYLSLDRVGNVEMTPSTFTRIRFGLLGFMDFPGVRTNDTEGEKDG